MTKTRRHTLGALALCLTITACEKKTRSPEERAQQLRELIIKLDPGGKGRAKICEDLQAIGAGR